jgi:hypothetical protein
MKWVLVVCAVAVLAAGLYTSGPTPSASAIAVTIRRKALCFRPTLLRPRFSGATPNPPRPHGGLTSRSRIAHIPLQFWLQCEKMKLGELDTSLVGYVPPTSLTRATRGAHLEAKSEGVGGNQETFGKGDPAQ